MKIKNLSFLTPSTSSDKIILEKDYSQKFIISDGSYINLSSNIGPKRNQQDSIAVAENNGYILMLVADGVGGLEKGEEASYIIAKTIKEWLESQSKESLDQLNEIKLKDILTELITYTREKILPKDAGTTLNMSIVGPQNTLIVNIGDSRAYSIKDKKINLRTIDDSLAFSIFKPTTEEERDKIRFYRKNNIITNVIKKSTPPKVNVTTIENEEYDILCHLTDGVSDVLSEEIIRICLLKEKPALSLVQESINKEPEYTPYISSEFFEYVSPHDNASAVVYTKKR